MSLASFDILLEHLRISRTHQILNNVLFPYVAIIMVIMS